VLWKDRPTKGKRFVDPYSRLANVINAEGLVSLYLETHPLVIGNPNLTGQTIADILPHALYSALNSTQADKGHVTWWEELHHQCLRRPLAAGDRHAAP